MTTKEEHQQKVITIVHGNNKNKKDCVISNEIEFDRLLRGFQAIALEDVENGWIVMDYESLISGKTYKTTTTTIRANFYPMPPIITPPITTTIPGLRRCSFDNHSYQGNLQGME